MLLFILKTIASLQHSMVIRFHHFKYFYMFRLNFDMFFRWWLCLCGCISFLLLAYSKVAWTQHFTKLGIPC